MCDGCFDNLFVISQFIFEFDFFLAGWGRLNNGAMPYKLQTIDLISISFDQCNKYYDINAADFCTLNNEGQGLCVVSAKQIQTIRNFSL